MPTESPTYDLMLLLSTSVEDDRRSKILNDVETAISGAKGSIVHNADWGTRPLAYRIDHQTEAEYHLIQFAGPTTLLESLGHSLGITDGVLRHRIIKVLPGTPPPPAPERVAVAARVAAPDAESAPAGAGTDTGEAAPPPAAAEGSEEDAAGEAPVEEAPLGEAPIGEAPAEDVVPLDDEIVEGDIESIE